MPRMKPGKFVKFSEEKGAMYNRLVECLIANEFPESLDLIKEYADTTDEWCDLIRYDDRTVESHEMRKIARYEYHLQLIEHLLGEVFEGFRSNPPPEFNEPAVKAHYRELKAWRYLRCYYLELLDIFIESCEKTFGEHYRAFNMLLSHFVIHHRRNNYFQADKTWSGDEEEEDSENEELVDDEELPDDEEELTDDEELVTASADKINADHFRQGTAENDAESDDKDISRAGSHSNEELSGEVQHQKYRAQIVKKSTRDSSASTPTGTKRKVDENSENESEKGIEEERPSKKRKHISYGDKFPRRAPESPPTTNENTNEDSGIQVEQSDEEEQLSNRRERLSYGNKYPRKAPVSTPTATTENVDEDSGIKVEQSDEEEQPFDRRERPSFGNKYPRKAPASTATGADENVNEDSGIQIEQNDEEEQHPNRRERVTYGDKFPRKASEAPSITNENVDEAFGTQIEQGDEEDD